MGGQNYCFALFFYFFYKGPEISARLRIKTGGGFVQEYQFRVVDDGQGQQKPLTLASGKFSVVPASECL